MVFSVHTYPKRQRESWQKNERKIEINNEPQPSTTTASAISGPGPVAVPHLWGLDMRKQHTSLGEDAEILTERWVEGWICLRPSSEVHKEPMCIESPRWTSALLFSKLFTSFLIMPIQLNWHCSVIWWQSSWLHFTSSCQPLTAGCTVTKSGSVTVCLRIHPPTSSFQKRNLQATLQCAFLTRPHHKYIYIYIYIYIILYKCNMYMYMYMCIIWMILEGPKPQTLDFPFPMQAM